MSQRWGLVAHVVLVLVVCAIRLIQPPELSAARALVSWRDDARIAANARAMEDRVRLVHARIEGAIGRYTQATAIAQEVVARAVDRGDAQLEAAALLVRGQNEERTGALAEAEATLRRAVATATRADDRPTRAAALVQLVYLVGDGRDAARRAEALAFAEAATAAIRLGDVDPQLEPQLANNLAVVAKRADDLDLARAHAERSVAGYERLLGSRHPSTLRALVNLGNIQRAQKQHAAAEQTLRRAVDGLASSLGEHHPLVAITLSNLAITVAQQDRPHDAVPLFRRALEIRTHNDPGHPDLAKAHYNLARACADAHEYANAVVHYAHGLELRRRSGTADDALREYTDGLAHAAAQLVRVG